MKHLYLLILTLVSLTYHTVQAQQYSIKFGKPTSHELKMTSYPEDTTAEAVILYDMNTHDMEYAESKNFFILKSDYHRKVKVLKSSGGDHANITLMYYDRTYVVEERITNIEGWVYNLENGEMVKTKLDKSFIFDEEASNGWKVIKFTLPGVKVGSVFEYKYTKTCDRIDILPDFDTQSDIPIMRGEYFIEIPEFFKFSKEMKGFEKIEVTKSEVTRSIPGIDQGYVGNQLRCTTKNIPALRKEPYVWNVNDYSSGVNFELTSIELPGMFKYDLSNTWGAVEYSLKNNTYLYTNINSTTPFKEEVATLKASTNDELMLISMILDMVKSKIRWNGVYALFDNHPREAIKNGTGNNAQINSVIYRCLQMAGYNPYVVVLSPREFGRLPEIYPTMNSLNSYIVGVDLSDGGSVYMDGSSNYGGINVLPESLMVDRARKITESSNKWVDLTRIANHAITRNQMIMLDSTGLMNVRTAAYYSNSAAYDYRRQRAIHPDSTQLLSELQENSSIKIDSVTLKGTHPASNIIEEVIELSEKVNQNGEFLYINPLYIPHFTEHPFTQSLRKLPIEFSYPNTYTILSTIMIPEGYTISDLPKSEARTFKDQSITVSYLVSKPNERMVQLKYQFLIKRSLYPNTYYDMIREIWDFAATKNKDLIVLKKTIL